MTDLARGTGTTLSVAAANTLVVVSGQQHDRVQSPEQLSAWLSERIGEAISTRSGSDGRDRIGDADVAAFRRLRAALRELFEAEPGARASHQAALAALNHAASVAPRWQAIAGRRSELVITSHTAARYADAALAVIAADAMALLTGPHAADVRMCQAPTCIQFFLASSHHRRWCSPGCGNRARVARHYDRHRRDPAD
jgi:predicted RNA-binding Zn ribbon-like protein